VANYAEDDLIKQ